MAIIFSGTLKRLCSAYVLLSAVLLLCCTGETAFSHDQLILGIHPFHTVTILEKKFTPLAEYLSKELNIPVVVRVGSSYAEHIDAVGRDKLDIAYLGPVQYVRMVDKYGNKPLLACQETDGTPFFRGIIITRQDSPSEKLADLEFGEFAFVDIYSTMGYILPAFLLLKENPAIIKENNYQMLKTHENVALAVLTGDFEAGAVKESVYQLYRHRGLKELARTPAAPEHLFVARTNLSAGTIKKLRKALWQLSKTDSGQHIMQAIKPTLTGFVPVEDEAYDGLRTIIERLAEESTLK